MRLTTLARKIDKTPSQLIAYLKEKNIEIPNGIHGKLEKEVAEAVLSEFIDDVEEVIEEDEVITGELPLQEDLTGEEIKENVEEEAVKTDISDTEENLPETAEITEEIKTATIEDLESAHFEEVDLIKAKKVKLEGIKVVGKIDLPEKPKKVEVVEDEEVEEGGKEKDKIKAKKEPRKFDRNRKKNKNSKSKRFLSYEEKLKEEEREKLKLRRRRENAERKRKQKFYEENIKPKHVYKQRNKKQQKPKEKSTILEKEVVVYKNPVKRLWAWLNGKYDRY